METVNARCPPDCPGAQRKCRVEEAGPASVHRANGLKPHLVEEGRAPFFRTSLATAPTPCHSSGSKGVAKIPGNNVFRLDGYSERDIVFESMVWVLFGQSPSKGGDHLYSLFSKLFTALNFLNTENFNWPPRLRIG